MSDRVFTVEQLAERWACSIWAIYPLLYSGELKGFRVGRVWRISGTAVEEFEKGEN